MEYLKEEGKGKKVSGKYIEKRNNYFKGNGLS
jgi:hypothetical protein